MSSCWTRSGGGLGRSGDLDDEQVVEGGRECAEACGDELCVGVGLFGDDQPYVVGWKVEPFCEIVYAVEVAVGGDSFPPFRVQF